MGRSAGESREMPMNDRKERWIGMLYPRRCPLCHRILGESHELAHEKCREKAPLIREPKCKKCGKGLESGEAEYCMECAESRHVFTRGLAVYAYDEGMRESVHQLKFYNKREYADFYVSQMCRVLEPVLPLWRPQVLLPVPLHPSRRRQRGFNQAELLAWGIGKQFQIPVDSALVERVKKTRPQRELDRKKRKNNLKNAFKMKEHDVKLDRVLIIDDIYTTGSTIDAISECLRAQGVTEIYFAALCTGKTG